MSAEIKKEIQLDIAHILFIDIVGYSKLSINDQHAAVEQLNRIVRASEQFQQAEAASRLLKIPTGDGMALVFYTSPEAPAQCALEISFFGTECGAFAHADTSFAIVARKSIQQAKDSALSDCGKRGRSCRLVAAVCADGADRTTRP